MQHFFVTQMDHSAQEALDNVSSIVDEVKLNSAELVKASRTQQVDDSGATTSVNDAVSEVKSSDDPSSK